MTTKAWKQCLGRAYSLFRTHASPRRQEGFILTYHSVSDSGLGVSTAEFRQQISWLSSNTLVTDLDSLIGGRWFPSPSGLLCAITFDDGYASVYRHAFPVLSEFRLPATVYLVVDAISGSNAKRSNEFPGLYPDEDMLTWGEIRQMTSNNIQFGSHLMRHKDLTSLTRCEADLELRDSKRLIEDKLSAPCSSFCYPWGRYNRRCLEAVRKAGYLNAVTAIQDRWRSDEKLDLFRIPRADIRRDYTIFDFMAVGRGDWDFLGYIQRFRRWMT